MNNDQSSAGKQAVSPISDHDLSSLLQSLPREQAALGFEDRVLRRVRAQPNPPLTFARGIRFAAPLVVAATLGFVFGPSLLGPDASESRTGVEEVALAPVKLEPSPYVANPLPLPSGLANNGQAQVVAMPGARGQSPPSLDLARSQAIQEIRREAARVRGQLEELRRVRSAAGSTVSMTTQDGVEVQMDLRELLVELERRGAEVNVRRRELLENARTFEPEPPQSRPNDPPLMPLW